MPEILFFPSIKIYYNEDYKNKSNGFEDEIERENRSNRISEHIQEITNPVILRYAVRELPAIQRPEEDLRQRQHAILNNVEKNGSGYKEHTRIFAAPVKIKTSKKEYKTENSSMGNNAPICKRISKKNSANEFIDNIRQNSSKSHIPVSNANIRSKISKKKKYPDRNSNVSKKEHDFLKVV